MSTAQCCGVTLCFDLSAECPTFQEGLKGGRYGCMGLQRIDEEAQVPCRLLMALSDELQSIYNFAVIDEASNPDVG